MFGMGGTEILVILIVALLFLGPDKLPDAAKQISKGIRDIKKQSRVLQQTIEDDEHIGGAIRDLRSALRGEDVPARPRPVKSPKQIEASPLPDPVAGPVVAAALSDGGASAGEAGPEAGPEAHIPAPGDPATPGDSPAPGEAAAAPPPKLTLPATAGEPDEAVAASGREDADLAVLVKPAPNTIARATPAAASPEPSEPKHG